jgi:hypothetical protein
MQTKNLKLHNLPKKKLIQKIVIQKQNQFKTSKMIFFKIFHFFNKNLRKRIFLQRKMKIIKKKNKMYLIGWILMNLQKKYLKIKNKE